MTATLSARAPTAGPRSRKTLSAFHCTHRLDDGRQVLVRELTDDDADALAEAFQRADPADLRRRFLGPPPPLGVILRHLHHTDRVHHVALGAFDDAGSLVGVAQFDRSNDEPEAELAIEVDHHWKSHRLGTLLLTDLVEDARRCGIQHLTATYFMDNVPIVRLLRDIDEVAHVSTSYDAGIGSADIDLG